MAVRSRFIRFALAALIVGPAACRAGDGGDRALLRAVPDDYQLVVAVDVDRVRTTWLAGAGRLIGADLDACVLDRARVARHLVVAWDGEEEWLLGLAGPGVTAAGCTDLGHRDGDRAWAGTGVPRAGRERGFFSDGERRRRWRTVASSPVRAIADLDVSPGITAHATATLDPRDGVDARVVARFGDRAAVSGALQLLTRWRAELDRDRLGGAWPLVATIESRVDTSDRRAAALVVEARLAGEPGAVAAALAVVAALDGAAAPSTSCRIPDGPWTGRVRCAAGGWIEIDGSVRDEILDDPTAFATGARVVPSIRNGTQEGIKLIAVRPSSLLAALGLRNGDVITAVAGVPIDSVDRALDAYVAIRDADTVDLAVERRGQTITLRYRIR